MVVSTSGTLGKSAIVRKEHLPLMLNTSIIRFRPIDKLSYSFMYQFLNSQFFQDNMKSMATGSVQSNFGPVHLKQIEMIIPDEKLLKAYAMFANSLYEKISYNISQIQTLEAQDLITNNKTFHRFLTDGVPVEYNTKNGIKNDIVWLFDFNDIDNNEFLAVNQLTIKEGRENRRPDVILFINGLPLVLIELKNPVDENASIWSAYTQLQTYIDLVPSIFRFNEILIISDGLEARAGTLTSPQNRFSPWKRTGENSLKNSPDIVVEYARHYKGLYRRKPVFIQ